MSKPGSTCKYEDKETISCCLDGDPQDGMHCITGVAYCVCLDCLQRQNDVPMVLLSWFFIMDSDCSNEYKVEIFKSFIMGLLCCI